MKPVWMMYWHLKSAWVTGSSPILNSLPVTPASDTSLITSEHLRDRDSASFGLRGDLVLIGSGLLSAWFLEVVAFFFFAFFCFVCGFYF